MAYADYQQLIDRSSALYGLPRGLLAGLLDLESGFDPDAVSPQGAVGIAQIHLPSHPDVTAAQARDPSFSIPYAAQLLSSGIRSCGSTVGGLVRYLTGRCAAYDAADALGTTGLDYAGTVLQRATAYGYRPTAQDVAVLAAAGGTDKPWWRKLWDAILGNMGVAGSPAGGELQLTPGVGLPVPSGGGGTAGQAPPVATDLGLGGVVGQVEQWLVRAGTTAGGLVLAAALALLGLWILFGRR